MNEITLHGNLTADPVVHTNRQTGKKATTFDLAVNPRWYDRTRGMSVDRPPVYHRVVCFGDLATNAAGTLRKGMTVTVTGSFADDSYTPTGADRPIRRIRLEAADVAVSLRWAVAAVDRQTTTADAILPAVQAPADVAAEASEQAADDGASGDDQPTEPAEPPAAPAARTGGRRAARAQAAKPAAA